MTSPTLPSMWLPARPVMEGDLDIVVACKGTPFTILQSHSLPTPTVTFSDHTIVAELKLKMTDLQCSRLHYGSKKLRVLGKISTSVQCIYNGMVTGNLHLKASVVENLYENFDAHSIAGTKLTELLPFQVDQTHTNTTMDTTREEPTTPKRPKKKKKIDHSPSSDRSLTPSQVKDAQSPPSLIRNIISPPKNKTIPSSRDLLSPGSQCVRAWATKRAEIASRRSSPSPPRSPPGFPNPKHSPSVNISSLHMLVAENVGTAPGTHGPVFYPGQWTWTWPVFCSLQHRPPSNCGYNDRWDLPADFLMCSSVCKGAFCGCVREYYRWWWSYYFR